ncbi:MAG: DUF255 domain-containing protein [Acidimicrobiia bacterium]|nr:DUF255 domain-containing protein [Acidimicrobiia bacterium]
MSNRLADARSPYLLQHKDNPVDWYQWGDEPFDTAKERNVPVLLSIGYSACHWCHVMAHESFEDEETAAVMNERFVNIKVDREEHPDVDGLYMAATQAMTGQGGWPMTVWLTPQRVPFFAGTYFPSNPMQGMPSFRQVIDAVWEAWSERRDDLEQQGDRILEAIDRRLPAAADLPGESVLATAYEAMVEAADTENGGFGTAPKFPQQPNLEFLLRIMGKTWAAQSEGVLTGALDAMANGGIHDQLGGGFARYSVDTFWHVPHFEKMLYDNAQLARIYLWAGLELDRPDYIEVARDTLDYLLSYLAHPDGGLYAAEDADSEGVEGRFYVFTESEVEEILGDDAAIAKFRYDITGQGDLDGANVLRIGAEPGEIGQRFGLSAAETTARLDLIDERLLGARGHRVRPGLDHKIVAGWNGLALRAFAEAGRALSKDRYLEAARRLGDFVVVHLVDEGGRVKRTWADGQVGPDGVLEDHAAIAIGLYTLFGATGEVRWFDSAEKISSQLSHFVLEDGRFSDTADDTASGVLRRLADPFDNPSPSGSALAIEALLMGAALKGDLDRVRTAEKALTAVAGYLERAPLGVGYHLAVLATHLGGWREVAIVGEDRQDLTGLVWSRFRPDTVVAPSTDGSDRIPLLMDRPPTDPATGYVCRNLICDLPTQDPEVFQRQLTHDSRG